MVEPETEPSRTRVGPKHKGVFPPQVLAYMRAVKLAVASQTQDVKVTMDALAGQPNGERIKVNLTRA
jgi:hypothetical protein